MIAEARSSYKRLAALLLISALPTFGQTNSGELRLKVTDPSGLRVKTTVYIVSEANQYQNALTTNERGALDVRRLPYGIYHLEINQPGFAIVSESVEIRSSIPTVHAIQLRLPAVNQSVTVSAAGTLIDPDQAGSVSQIGSEFVQSRLGSMPGRSLQDLVNTQPGWLYEGNAVLHPRGSEYQTQLVVDGVPLTDNRSPSFGPEIDANDLQSISIYTAGFPAEYGRKMGGVVELRTLQDSPAGFHGKVVLSGGSFDTAGAFAGAQEVWGKNTFGASAGGDVTSHYLNPVVPENYTNTGTVGDFSINYGRDFTPKDRLSLILRHELSRYDLPNERVQQTWCDPPGQTSGPPCQRQNADNFETMAIVSYHHIFSPEVVASFQGMVRNNANHFWSNADSTPIRVFQHNLLNEGYLKGSITVDHGHHEWKVGTESDNMSLHERFRYVIPNIPMDTSQFDPSTLLTFAFAANRPDLEQAAFVQDHLSLGHWTLSAGLRWDHYQLLLNRQAVEPRFSMARYLPSAGMVLHFSYDRVFQTPSFENILLSSSTATTALNAISRQLPVQPSEGNYYEAGVTKAFFQKFKVDANYFRRSLDNFADDNQLENTTISFPIAFQNAVIYGAEAKVDLPDWKRFSGFASYSYEVGNAWFPVTGGLFLGANAVLPASGHFPDSQDQRNTVRARVRYQVACRFWIAGGIQYDSGLPFDFDGTAVQALAEYGPQVINRIDFPRGRIDPSFQVNASAGADIYKSDRLNVRAQLDGQNLTNVLDLIDFGGLFSGNAIGPSRSFAVRLATNF
jgi:hypothetical protein